MRYRVTHSTTYSYEEIVSSFFSRALDYREWVFMNPDLSVHLARYPEGEWVGLSAESAYGNLGRGVATGTLWDTGGWLGRTTQSLFLDRVSRS
jgi:hypothetical protein